MQLEFMHMIIHLWNYECFRYLKKIIPEDLMQKIIKVSHWLKFHLYSFFL